MFGAHHDAITGTEGDQVYLDLLGGWREAWERGAGARAAAIAHLAGLADTASLGADGGLAVVVVNSLSFARTAMATIALELPDGWPAWLELTDDSGAAVPFLAEGISRTADGGLSAVTITFRASDVPGVGYRSYVVRPGRGSGSRTGGWQPADGAPPVLENDALLVEADPARGGTLSRVLNKRSGTELLAPGGGGNELHAAARASRPPALGRGPVAALPGRSPDGAGHGRARRGAGRAQPGRQPAG